jgi:hypothetical protein
MDLFVERIFKFLTSDIHVQDVANLNFSINFECINILCVVCSLNYNVKHQQIAGMHPLHLKTEFFFVLKG